MATIEYYFVRVRELKSNKYIQKDFSKLLKEKVDSLKPEEKYCENRTCSAILAEYIENADDVYSITFDFSKLTGDTVTSALKYNLLENIDTFKELDDKTLALIKYTNDDLDNIKNIVKSHDSIHDIIVSLESLELDYFKVYKILQDNDINVKINNKNLVSEFYKKNLKRYKKDKSFFNTFMAKNTNVLQFQKNIEAFEFRKLEEYINRHLLEADDLYITFEKIYDSEFLEMLKYRDLSLFEIKYHSSSKDTLLNDNLNSLLFQLSNSFGPNTTKICAKADKDSNLSNEKILRFFEEVNKLGILEECKVRVKGNNSSTKSTDKGSSLKYVTRSQMKTINTANSIFLDAYDKNIDIIEDRIIYE